MCVVGGAVCGTVGPFWRGLEVKILGMTVNKQHKHSEPLRAVSVPCALFF